MKVRSAAAHRLSEVTLKEVRMLDERGEANPGLVLTRPDRLSPP